MTNPFIPVSDAFFVSGQISPEDIEAAKALGVTLIINNRPDGEGLGQPKGEAIEAAAKAAGLSYAAIPVGMMGIKERHLDAFMAAIDAHQGAALGFCKSGLRSLILRAYALARAGYDIDRLMAEAADAGYDLSGQRSALEALAGG